MLRNETEAVGVAGPRTRRTVREKTGVISIFPFAVNESSVPFPACLPFTIH